SDKKRLAAARQAIDEHEKDLPPNTVLVSQSDSNAPIKNNSLVIDPTIDGRIVVDPPHAPPPLDPFQPAVVKKDNWTKDTWEAEEQRLADNIGSLEEKIATDEEKIS